jgi:hypothetical protein
MAFSQMAVSLEYVLQEHFDKPDNLQREKVAKRDNFPCYLT